jgi:hypothetical protein
MRWRVWPSSWRRRGSGLGLRLSSFAEAFGYPEECAPFDI